jgi:hypothetical protein
MRIFRLVFLSVFVAAAMPALGQSQPGQPLNGAKSFSLPTGAPVLALGNFIAPAGSQPTSPGVTNGSRLRVEMFEAQKSSACYSIRDYRFTRVSPDSDATKLTAYSDCPSASFFQERDVSPSGR